MTTKQSRQPAATQVGSVFAVMTDRECGTDPEEMGQAMGSAFGQIHQFAAQHHLQFTGPPRAIYAKYGPDGAKFTVAIPITPPPSGVPDVGAVRVAEVPGGKALRFMHTGPYRDLVNTYDGITEWMKGEGMLESDADWPKYSPVWEEYANDPRSTPEAELVTHIYVPVK